METIEESVDKEGGLDGNLQDDQDQPDHDFDKPFQDFRVSCKFRKILYNFGFNKKVEQLGYKDEEASTKYYIHAI